MLLLPLQVAAVDFQLPDLNGKSVRLSDFRGKWVVVNFWASWCGPCVRELPELSAFQDGHAARVQVIGINFEEASPQATRDFLANLPATNFPHLSYQKHPEGLPEAFFIDRTGKHLALQALAEHLLCRSTRRTVRHAPGATDAQTTRADTAIFRRLTPPPPREASATRPGKAHQNIRISGISDTGRIFFPSFFLVMNRMTNHNML
jgi:thiol-disulfide isomerase/thioredoxin